MTKIRCGRVLFSTAWSATLVAVMLLLGQAPAFGQTFQGPVTVAGTYSRVFVEVIPVVGVGNVEVTTTCTYAFSSAGTAQVSLPRDASPGSYLVDSFGQAQLASREESLEGYGAGCNPTQNVAFGENRGPPLTVKGSAVTAEFGDGTTTLRTTLNATWDGNRLLGTFTGEFQNSFGSRFGSAQLDLPCAFDCSLEFDVVDPACSAPTVCSGEYVEDSGDLKPAAALALAQVSRIGAVADCVTSLLLRVPTTVPVTFTVAHTGTDGGTLTKRDGSPLTGPVVPEPDNTPSKFAFALYTVPPGLDESVDQAAVQFTATLQPGATLTKTIALVRPIPVLVHGVWSSASAWSGLRDYLNTNGYNAAVCNECLVDYGGYDGGAPSFDLGTSGGSRSVGALRLTVTRALDHLHNLGYAATQVDIVGHSMGGLIARARAKQAGYKSRSNYKQGTFHRIISVGTPHNGSPLANWLWSHQDDRRPVVISVGFGPAIPKLLTLKQYFELGLLGGVVPPLGKLGPAVKDLRTDSAALKGLGSTLVPAHAIYGVESHNLLSRNPAVEFVLNSLPLAFQYRGCTIDSLLGGAEKHDTIVPIESQKGSLADRYTDRVDGVVHAGTGTPTETSEHEIFVKIDILLRESKGSSFASGFPAPVESLPAEPADCRTPSQPLAASVRSSTAVTISLTPPAGTVVDPGDSVPITFTVTGGESVERAIVTIGGVPYGFTGAGPFTVPYQVPADRVGRIDIVAGTVGSGTEDYIATSYLVVVPTATLAGIAVEPSPLTLAEAGELAAVHVTASYQDGSTADATTSGAGATYSLLSGTTAVVTVSPDGVVEAHNTGQETLVVHFGGLTANVPVTVSITNRAPVVGAVNPTTLVAGSVVDVNLSAVDPDSDDLTLAGVVLPLFASVVDEGAGVGKLHLAPALSDVGHYPVVVSAVDDGNPVLEGSRTIVVNVTGAPFTDDPLIPGVTVVKALHILELRSRIDALRARFALASYAWVDPSVSARITVIQAAHIINLRAALSEVYVAAGITPPTYSDPAIAAGMALKYTHVAELRTAIVLVE